MARITMLVTSELDRDPRVQKEARLAQEAGHDVTVVCRSYEGKPMPYHVVTLDIGRPSGMVSKYAERLLTNIRLARIASRRRPNIIHANDLDTLPAAYVASHTSGAQLLYDAHELWSDMGVSRAGRLGRVIALHSEKLLSRRCQSVITVSRYRGQAMSKALGIKEPVVVMNTPYYVNTVSIPPAAWVEHYSGRRIVLYQGRYTDGMGLTEAIQAAHYLPDDVVLAFRGYGVYEDTMRQVIAAERLESRVTLLPPVPMNDLVLSAIGADLGLVLYKPVNLNNLYAAPNKLFEFIMAGVPCVGSDLPYIRQILCDSDLGVVFRPGDSSDMARAIMELLDAPERLHDMRLRCLQQARQYSWETEGAKLLNEYDRLLAKAH